MDNSNTSSTGWTKAQTILVTVLTLGLIIICFTLGYAYGNERGLAANTIDPNSITPDRMDPYPYEYIETWSNVDQEAVETYKMIQELTKALREGATTADLIMDRDAAGDDVLHIEIHYSSVAAKSENETYALEGED